MGAIALWPNTRVIQCKYCVSRKRNEPVIRSIGTIFYSLVYVNLRLVFSRLKFSYSVISVLVDSLPADTGARQADGF